MPITGDFYEDDEPIEKIRAAWEAGEKQLTGPAEVNTPEAELGTTEQQFDAMWTKGVPVTITTGTSTGCQPNPEVDRLRAENATQAAEIEKLNLEVMAHQVGEGYEKGHQHGSAAAEQHIRRFRAQVAERDETIGELREELALAQKVAGAADHLLAGREIQPTTVNTWLAHRFRTLLERRTAELAEARGRASWRDVCCTMPPGHEHAHRRVSHDGRISRWVIVEATEEQAREEISTELTEMEAERDGLRVRVAELGRKRAAHTIGLVAAATRRTRTAEAQVTAVRDLLPDPLDPDWETACVHAVIDIRRALDAAGTPETATDHPNPQVAPAECGAEWARGLAPCTQPPGHDGVHSNPAGDMWNDLATPLAPAPPGMSPREYAALRLCLSDGHQPGVTPDGQPCAYHRSAVDLVARTLLAPAELASEPASSLQVPAPGATPLATSGPTSPRRLPFVGIGATESGITSPPAVTDADMADFDQTLTEEGLRPALETFATEMIGRFPPAVTDAMVQAAINGALERSGHLNQHIVCDWCHLNSPYPRYAGPARERVFRAAIEAALAAGPPAEYKQTAENLNSPGDSSTSLALSDGEDQ